jgi:ATP-dependent DNA helicase
MLCTMLRGLSIGIDSYQAPVNRLSCAGADAAALGSLFEDTLGGRVCLLCDEDATIGRIQAELASLQAAEHDDLIVISFSGMALKIIVWCP